MLMRAAGFACMALAHQPWLLGWPACCPDWAARCDPPRSALVVKLVRARERGRFSLLMMGGQRRRGAGRADWQLAAGVGFPSGVLGAAVFVVTAIFNAVWLPAWRISTERIAMREGMQRVCATAVSACFTLTGYYILAVQVMLMLPVMVNQVAAHRRR